MPTAGKLPRGDFNFPITNYKLQITLNYEIQIFVSFRALGEESLQCYYLRFTLFKGFLNR